MGTFQLVLGIMFAVHFPGEQKSGSGEGEGVTVAVQRRPGWGGIPFRTSLERMFWKASFIRLASGFWPGAAYLTGASA